MNTLFIGTIFFILAYMFNAILNALGDTRSFRNFLIAGFFLNILLDPWFIYGGLGIPPLGIVGIALATIIIQFLGNVYLGWRVNRTGLIGDKDWHDIIPKPKPFKEIAHQGLPASVTMLTVGIGFFVITYFVSTFGKAAVAAYGIGIRVEQIVLIPTIGLNIATLTLVAQNNGARLFHRITETLRMVLTYGGGLMALGTVIVFVFARQFMAFFSSDPQVIAIGTTYMKIDAFVFYAYVILFVTVATLQGLKKPFFAVWIGFARQLIAPVLIFPLFITIFGMGLLGIWWGFFLITWSAATFSLLYVRHTIKKMIT